MQAVTLETQGARADSAIEKPIRELGYIARDLDYTACHCVDPTSGLRERTSVIAWFHHHVARLKSVTPGTNCNYLL